VNYLARVTVCTTNNVQIYTVLLLQTLLYDSIRFHCVMWLLDLFLVSVVLTPSPSVYHLSTSDISVFVKFRRVDRYAWSASLFLSLTTVMCRFYGRIAKQPQEHDSKTLKAIRENAHGLAGQCCYVATAATVCYRFKSKFLFCAVESVIEWLGHM